jgi:hypothetical protein
MQRARPSLSAIVNGFADARADSRRFPPPLRDGQRLASTGHLVGMQTSGMRVSDAAMPA